MAAQLGGRGDFWLFDDDFVVLLAYDDAGRVKNVSAVSEEQARAASMPFMLPLFREARDKALRLATPLAQYVAEHNITEERTRAA